MPSNQTGSEKKKIPIIKDLFYQSTIPTEKSYLIGSKCGLCGYIAFPKKAVCPSCVRDDTMKDISLSGRGKINSFTVARVAPPGFKAPYLQAYIDLAEGPRVFSLITECEPVEESLDIGMEVEFVIDKITEDDAGNELIGYKFRPLKG